MVVLQGRSVEGLQACIVEERTVEGLQACTVDERTVERRTVEEAHKTEGLQLPGFAPQQLELQKAHFLCTAVVPGSEHTKGNTEPYKSPHKNYLKSRIYV